MAYTPDPKAKGLDVLGEAWRLAAIPDARLLVFGIEAERGRAFLARYAIPEPAGLEWRGTVPRAEFRAALREAQVHITSARWEDWGQAQLEALADGALLATTPAGGPFEALAFARALDPRLVADAVDRPRARHRHPRRLRRVARGARALPARGDGPARAVPGRGDRGGRGARSAAGAPGLKPILAPCRWTSRSRS